MRLWGSDDYSWVVVKELEFGVGYKRLRWCWLSDGVKFVRWGGAMAWACCDGCGVGVAVECGGCDDYAWWWVKS